MFKFGTIVSISTGIKLQRDTTGIDLQRATACFAPQMVPAFSKPILNSKDCKYFGGTVDKKKCESKCALTPEAKLSLIRNGPNPLDDECQAIEEGACNMKKGYWEHGKCGKGSKLCYVPRTECHEIEEDLCKDKNGRWEHGECGGKGKKLCYMPFWFDCYHHLFQSGYFIGETLECKPGFSKIQKKNLTTNLMVLTNLIPVLKVTNMRLRLKIRVIENGEQKKMH